MNEGPGQRPAPQITISDPNRPTDAPADVLGSGTERDPWRPKAWQLKAVALAVLLTAAGVLPGRVVAARAQDRRAAVAAAEAVRLSVVSGAPRETAPGRFRLVLSNDSPGAVRVLDARLDGPGYRLVRVGARVAGGQGVAIEVPETRTCGQDLLEAGQSGLAHVRARTPGGLVVTRTVIVPVDSWTTLVEAAQRRCGYLVPEAALTTTVLAVRTGTHLVLQVTLHNASKAPLELDVLGLHGGGISALPEPTLPFPLPPAATRTLRARIVIDDCSTARGSYLVDAFPLSDPLLELQVAPVLAGGARHGIPTGIATASSEAGALLRDYLFEQCGPVRPGDQAAG